MKKILYATDFSKSAEKAFSFALKIAEKHEAELIMLHVFDIPTIYTQPYTNDPFEMKRHAIRGWKDELAEFFMKHKTDVKVKYVAIENNSVTKGILSVIKENDPGLIVIGCKGKNKLQEAMVGSTTKDLIKASPVPVLAIPEKAIYREFMDVLYATDFQEADIEAIGQLADLVEPYDPEINAIHVSTYKEFMGDEKMEWFKDLVRDNIKDTKITFELLLSDNVFDKLNEYIRHHDFDMLVMLEKERSGLFDRLFHTDLVTKMEFHTFLPLLTFNEHFLRVSDEKGMKSTDRIKEVH